MRSPLMIEQQLGDCLGKGAFGQVYRVYHHCSPSFNQLILLQLGALNWATGETCAVKEIQLSNIPKSELGEIMVRIMPPNLDGTHIVRSPKSTF